MCSLQKESSEDMLIKLYEIDVKQDIEQGRTTVQEVMNKLNKLVGDGSMLYPHTKEAWYCLGAAKAIGFPL